MSYRSTPQLACRLSHPDRLMLLHFLLMRDLTCTQLARETMQPRRAVARTLDEMEAWGVVTARMVTSDVVYALARHDRYVTTGFDLGIFDQAVWLMSRGRAPFVTTIGIDVFADHVSPVLLAFVPLLVGGKIYNALVKIMTVKIFIVLLYLSRLHFNHSWIGYLIAKLKRLKVAQRVMLSLR